MRRFIAAPTVTACLLMCGLLVQAQQRTYRGSFQSVRQVILRLENRANLFRNGVDNNLRTATGAYSTNSGINVMATDFNTSVRRLRDNFDRRRATSTEVQDVLNQAARIDDLVRQNQLDNRSENLWASLRSDLNSLARAYSLTWQTATYSTPNSYPGYGDQNGIQRLTGTYRLDVSRSENARTAAERAARNLSYNDRDRILDLVSRRLEAPEEMAIDVRGRTVTLASTRAPQTTFDADGREHIETMANGRTIRSRASLTGNQLTVSTTGNRGNEFNVTFQPLDYGRSLTVVRRIYATELNQSVEVRSVYQRESDVARFDIYNSNSTGYQDTAAGSFVVPDGTRIVGILQNDLSTQNAAAGDRFTLRVSDPAEFREAIVEGHVSDIRRSGRLTGRSVMTLNFDQIRLRDGRTYSFGGVLESVVSRNGENVRVDSEGTVRDDNQTNRTGERAAIGTAVGAIIGAIAGGGKGAAIGAIVGAGAGAGSIYVEGRNDLQLDRGTELMIRASAPIRSQR